MQERVTHFAKTTTVSFKKLAIFVFCLTLGVVVVLGGFLSAFGKRKNYTFADGTSFYAYYTSEQTQENIDSSALKQKKNGGAGYIYEQGTKKFVCAFLYKTKQDAQNIKAANINLYPNGDVVEISTLKLSSRAKKILNNTENYLLLFHFFEDCFYECFNLSLEWDSSKLTESKLLSKVLLLLNKANEICASFEISDDLSASIELFCYEIEEFMAKTTSKVERSSGIKLLCFKIIDLFNVSAEILNNRN